MRNIYKDEVIGDINSNLIYNNEIKGVFGEIVDISQMSREQPNIPNILTSTQRSDYNYQFNFNIIKQATITTNTYLGVMGEANYKYSFNLNIDIEQTYSTPIENVEISAKLYYTKYSYNNTYSGTSPSGSPVTGVAIAIHNFLVGKNSISQPQSINTTIARPENNAITQAVLSKELIITNKNVEKFKVNFSALLDWDYDSGRIFTDYNMYFNPVDYITIHTIRAVCDVIQPNYIEITIRGDTYRITPQAFQYGSTENALEQPQSTLLTTKSTYKGQPLWEHIGQRITSEWYNGKQTVTLPVIINDESDIRTVDEEVYIFDVRRGEIDETDQNQINNASIFKTVDSRAKKFIIVNITYNYDGSFTQLLDLQEVIE